jgi:hypothetical protein
MRLMVAIVMTLAFASCATHAGKTRWPNIDATYECSAVTCPTPEATEDAAAAFVLAWYAQFGTVCLLDGLHVSWEPLVARGVLGRYWSLADVMQVRVGGEHPDRVADTSMGHELVHMCLYKTLGDPDANHEFDPGPWTVEVQLFLDVYDEFLRRQYTEDL